MFWKILRIPTTRVEDPDPTHEKKTDRTLEEYTDQDPTIQKLGYEFHILWIQPEQNYQVIKIVERVSTLLLFKIMSIFITSLHINFI